MNKALPFGLVIVFLCCSAHSVDFSRHSYSHNPASYFSASGFQRFARLKNSDGDVSTRYNPTAGSVGYIYSPGMWYAGAAFSWEHGNRRYSDSAGNGTMEVRSDMPGVSVFGGMKTLEGWYVDASAFLGYGSFKAHNIKTPGGMNFSGSRTHEMAYAMGLEGGKSFDMGNEFLITPHVGVDVSHTPSEQYNYANGGYYGVKRQTYFEIPLGVSFSKSFNFGCWLLTPKVDLTLVNSIGHMDAMNAQPGFAYRAADSWKVAGIGGDHVGGRVSAGFDAKLGERTSVGLDYTYEGRKNYNDHRISAILGWSF